MSKFDHVIFDLDGTLVDSAVLCSHILNQMLAERGSARTLTVDCARPHMSLGGPHLVRTMLADECGELEAELTDFRARYAAHPTPETSLFPGVRQGLERLSARGLQLSICSNKPQHLCEKVVRELSLGGMISVIVGTAEGRMHKPHPQLMNLTLHAAGSRAERSLFVGDSEQDEALAKATGVPFAFVGYGYPSPGWTPDGLTVFDTFEQLVDDIEAELDGDRVLRRVA